ncbi:MAG: hypothetical protein DHS20C18_52080 [Saprospiraceae bacterium]|nr:MAG: hypothetical protein DHS20C18_52080 [Saprospiraceae bacterium]
MKDFTRLLLICLAIILMGAGQSLLAQENQDANVVIQKITHEDGTTTLVKKRIQNKEDVKAYIESLGSVQGESVEIQVISVGEEASDRNAAIGYIRTSKSCDQKIKTEGMTMTWNDSDTNWDFNFKHDRNDRRDYRFDRPLIGIYPGGGSDQGLRVSSLVDGGGAAAAGLASGDMITDINGTPIQGLSDLRTELSKYEAGDQVRVNYTRDGQNYSTAVTLTKRRHGSNGRSLCSVFIGVSLGGHGVDGKGIRISGTIDGFPASKEDVQRGDVIIAFDGVEVNTVSELQTQRDKHELGEVFSMTVLRNGSPVTIHSTFNSCEEDEPQEEPVITEEEPVIETFTPEELESPAVPEIEIDNELALDRYSAFPNPTFGQVRVQFEAEAVATLLEITDITGKVIYREQMNRFDGYYDEELNLDNATPGTLVITIRQGNKITAKKIVLMGRV